MSPGRSSSGPCEARACSGTPGPAATCRRSRGPRPAGIVGRTPQLGTCPGPPPRASTRVGGAMGAEQSGSRTTGGPRVSPVRYLTDAIELVDQSAEAALAHAATLHDRLLHTDDPQVAEHLAAVHQLVGDIVSLRNAAELLKRLLGPA